MSQIDSSFLLTVGASIGFFVYGQAAKEKRFKLCPQAFTLTRRGQVSTWGVQKGPHAITKFWSLE